MDPIGEASTGPTRWIKTFAMGRRYVPPLRPSPASNPNNYEFSARSRPLRCQRASQSRRRKNDSVASAFRNHSHSRAPDKTRGRRGGACLVLAICPSIVTARSGGINQNPNTKPKDPPAPPAPSLLLRPPRLVGPNLDCSCLCLSLSLRPLPPLRLVSVSAVAV